MGLRPCIRQGCPGHAPPTRREVAHCSAICAYVDNELDRLTHTITDPYISDAKREHFTRGHSLMVNVAEALNEYRDHVGTRGRKSRNATNAQ